MNFGYAVASLVAVWLICNEIISILENISDIGVKLPPFMLRIVQNLKSQVESKADQALPVSASVALSDIEESIRQEGETQIVTAIEIENSTADNISTSDP